MLILAWIATSDGSIDESEIQQLYKISDASNHRNEIQQLLDIAKHRDTDALQLASEIVRKHFQGKNATLFLEMAIGMSVADGYLLPTENHILRYLADLLGMNRTELNDIFIAVTGQQIPNPTDPSTAQYWRARESKKKQSQSKSDHSHQQHQKYQSNDSKIVHACAVLGLEYGASKEEIKRAYRRLAQIHHPDRFASLGEESVATATNTFKRIKEAYDYLVTYA